MNVKPQKNALSLEQTSEGVTASQPYIVTDIPMVGTLSLAAVLDAPALPRIGAPFGRFGIQVLKRTVSTEASLVNGAMVTCEYGVADSSEAVAVGKASKERIELKVGTITERTSFDINGNALRVNYKGEGSLGVQLGQVQTAEVQKPVFRFTVRRDEQKIPFQKALDHTGKINRTQFSVFAPKTLLLLGIANSETNKGLSQEIAYEFVFKSDSWVHKAELILAGRLPVDAVLGNGIEFYDVFESIDFAGLGVSLSI